MTSLAVCTIHHRQSWTNKLKNLKALVTSKDRWNHQDNWIIFAAEDNVVKWLNPQGILAALFMFYILKYWSQKYQRPLLLKMSPWIVVQGYQVPSGSKWYKGFSVNKSWDMECWQTLLHRGWSKVLGGKRMGGITMFIYKNCYYICTSVIVSPNG